MEIDSLLDAAPRGHGGTTVFGPINMGFISDSWNLLLSQKKKFYFYVPKLQITD